ncbi:hypothetical protein AKO1_010473 [Acrasis kona]|uniref:Uncharacterized protein n=1 Tax=Acrasis kona TaxID=1008807 RepID=A0AAW2ZJQ4_9EUKA
MAYTLYQVVRFLKKRPGRGDKPNQVKSRTLEMDRKVEKRLTAANKPILPSLVKNKLYKETIFSDRTLSEGHLAEITKRKLKKKSAEDSKFCTNNTNRTYKPSQDMEFLPGLRRFGNEFKSTQAGILIPAFNTKHHITGAQIKTDHGNPKYTWLSSSSCTDGLSIHNEFGEPPLFYWADRIHGTNSIKKNNTMLVELLEHRTEFYWKIRYYIQRLLLYFDESYHQVFHEAHYTSFFNKKLGMRVIGLCEGGLKSKIASDEIEIPFIAPGGCDFMASKGVFREYLTDLCSGEKNERKQSTTFLLFPDAGAIISKHVSECNWDVLFFLSQLGYHIKVVWWGQETKKDLDVDEVNWKDQSFLERVQIIDLPDFYWKHGYEVQCHISLKFALRDGEIDYLFGYHPTYFEIIRKYLWKIVVLVLGLRFCLYFCFRLLRFLGNRSLSRKEDKLEV